MRRVAAIGMVAAALLLAGCSSGSDTTGSAETDQTTTAAPSADPSGAPGGSADFQAYTQCLSDNGVDVSSLGRGMGGGAGTPPSGMPTDRPTDFPSGMPTDRPTDFPSGMPTDGAGGGPGGGFGGGMQAPDGVDAETWQAAQDACADLRPTGGPGMGGPGGQNGTDSGSGTDYRVFWSCMSDHEVRAPQSGLPADLDASDANVAAALRICQRLLPDGTSVGTSAGTSAGT